MSKFRLDFVLTTQEDCLRELTCALEELGEGLEFAPVPQCGHERGKNFKVQVVAVDPTLIFDVCSQFGRFRSVRIVELP
jgi:hypothetical protein